MNVTHVPEAAYTVAALDPVDLSSGSGIDRADVDEALAAAFRRHYEPLVRLARVLVDHRTSAEEVVQEAFARTFERYSRVHGDVYPYLRTAVVNLSRGRLRRRGVRRAARHEPRPHEESAEANVCEAETRAELHAALLALPRRQREVIVLRYLERASTRQTAETLGLSEGSVKTHLRRGLAALRSELEVPA